MIDFVDDEIAYIAYYIEKLHTLDSIYTVPLSLMKYILNAMPCYFPYLISSTDVYYNNRTLHTSPTAFSCILL